MFPYYLYYIGSKKRNIASIDSKVPLLVPSLDNGRVCTPKSCPSAKKKVPLLDIQETTKQSDFRSERFQSNYLVNEADTTDVSENSFEKTLPSSIKLVENINTTNNEKKMFLLQTRSPLCLWTILKSMHEHLTNNLLLLQIYHLFKFNNQ